LENRGSALVFDKLAISMIRLHVIDDHSIIVDGIRQRIRHNPNELTITGSSDTVEHFVQSASIDAFDIIILDLWLPGFEPLENLQLIKKHFPSKPVVIFTQETSHYWIRTMLQNGANAHLLKSTERREFKEIIEKVYLGQTVVPAMFLDEKNLNMKQSLFRQKYMLKPSERAIVVQLANGATAKTIITDPVSSVSAIEKTLKKIRANFGVTTNPELVRVLMELKMI
jgi:DNA-binding NarL/FixJ family response regulator